MYSSNATSLLQLSVKAIPIVRVICLGQHSFYNGWRYPSLRGLLPLTASRSEILIVRCADGHMAMHRAGGRSKEGELLVVSLSFSLVFLSHCEYDWPCLLPASYRTRITTWVLSNFTAWCFHYCLVTSHCLVTSQRQVKQHQRHIYLSDLGSQYTSYES